MKQKVLHILNVIKNAPYFVKLIGFSAVATAAIVVSLNVSGATFAYNLYYGDKLIGQVESNQVFESAKSMAAAAIVGDNSEQYIYTPKLSLTMTLSERLNTPTDIANSILVETNEIAQSSALVVDGATVAIAQDSAKLESAMNSRLAAFNVSKSENSSEFVSNVEVQTVYHPVVNYSSDEELENAVSALDVKTTAKITTDIPVAYKTVTTKSSKQLVGYYRVTQQGQNGLNQKVQSVVYVNGVEVERKTEKNVVVKQPVNECVLIGTASSATISNSVSASAGLVYPVKRSGYYYISTYFRENSGRHKGIDIAIAHGTPIYSVLDGTVTATGYRNDYGYFVDVKHPNGMTTRYAHCSVVYAKTGDKVLKGQTIALVGSTGQSTGNHLHFELRVNGNLVDPLKYIQ